MWTLQILQKISLFPVDILATLLFIRLTEQPDFRRYQEEVNIRGWDT